jgi:hypothetical protein
VDLTPVDIDSARLPANYEAARAALAACASIDECLTWASKADALAAYFRMAKDEALVRRAKRIQARAIRRAGELLGDLNRPSQGGRPPKNREGNRPVSIKSIAERAGMSSHQRKQAIRVARIPEADFEAAVESAAPPTVTTLARMGTRVCPAPAPKTVGVETHTEPGAVRTVTYRPAIDAKIASLAEFARSIAPEDAAALTLKIPDTLFNDIRDIRAWLDAYEAALPRITPGHTD